MKIAFRALLGAGVLAIAFAGSAQTVVLQDFETTTSGNLPGAWSPSFSGTSTGNLVANSESATYSTEQAHTGSASGKLVWQWAEPATNLPKRIRIQPAAAGWLAGTNAAIDRSSTPYVGFYLYGASQMDQVALYMGEGAGGNGASPYEQFAPVSINWNGWGLYERHIVNDPVTGLFNGDGTLVVTNSMSGLMFYPPLDNAATNATVTYYVDDFTYSSTSRIAADVKNWSVY